LNKKNVLSSNTLYKFSAADEHSYRHHGLGGMLYTLHVSEIARHGNFQIPSLYFRAALHKSKRLHKIHPRKDVSSHALHLECPYLFWLPSFQIKRIIALYALASGPRKRHSVAQYFLAGTLASTNAAPNSVSALRHSFSSPVRHGGFSGVMAWCLACPTF